MKSDKVLIGVAIVCIISAVIMMTNRSTENSEVVVKNEKVSAVIKSKKIQNKLDSKQQLPSSSKISSLSQDQMKVVAKKALLEKNYCVTQEKCPFQVSAVYGYLIREMPIAKYEKMFFKLQAKIKKLDISEQEKGDLYSDMLIRLGDSYEGESMYANKKKSLAFQNRPLLIVSAFQNYLKTQPNPQLALHNVGKSIFRTQDAGLARTIHALMSRQYPDYKNEIDSYFVQINVKGFQG